MRRTHALGLAALIVTSALTLTACSSGASSAPTPSTSHVKPSGTINIAAFGGTLGQAVLSVAPEFTAETGIKVTSQDTNAPQLIGQLIQTRNQPQNDYDLVMVPPAVHQQGVEAKIWQPLTHSDVPMLADLPKVAVPDGQYAAFGTFRLGLTVNTKALAAAGVPVPTSWADLWNPIYKGHIVMGPLADNSVQALLDLLWDQEGSLAAAEKKFDQLIPNVKAFLNTTPEIESAISSGDAWVALLNESRAGIDKENGAPVEFVVPKPGAVVDWLLGIDVPANAPNKAAAYAFINFLLQPAQQSKIADAGFFSPVNPKATYSDRIKALSETPPGAKKGHVTNWKRITDNYNDLNKWWTSEVGS